MKPFRPSSSSSLTPLTRLGTDPDASRGSPTAGATVHTSSKVAEPRGKASIAPGEAIPQNTLCGQHISHASPARRRAIRRREAGSAARLGAEELLVLALDASPLVGVLGRGLLAGDIGPARGVLAVHLEPLLGHGLAVRNDRLDRAFRLAHPAIDAFVGVDDQHVLAFVEAIDRAHLDAIH